MYNREIICFHNPDARYGCFSNWYLSEFEIGGKRYSSMEQYMMYQKACVFWDSYIAGEIMATNDVAKIKQLGRKISGYNETVWNGLRQLIVYDGLYAKFSQNEKIRKILISTEDAILAEASSSDLIWGIGISIYDENRFRLGKWEGKNLLGFTLMRVRDKLAVE